MKVIAATLITLFLVGMAGAGVVQSKEPSLAEIVFYVGWYDVGKAALEGLKGIKEVKRGFHGASEINTVIYDPSIITTAEMVSALKAAGTYLGIAE